MPQYFSPGVYVEEVDSGPRPIQGVSTSVTGAVGVTLRGPTDGKPELVVSFGEFVKKFGGFLKEPDDKAIVNKWTNPKQQGGVWWRFADSVRGFFDNGGQQLYIKRVFSRTANSSSAELNEGLISEILSDAESNTKTLKVSHIIGIRTDGENSVTVYDGRTNTAIGGAATVSLYVQGSTESTITLQGASFPRSISAARGDYVVIRAIATTSTTKRIRFEASSKGKWGDDVYVRIRPTIVASLALQHDETISGNTEASDSLVDDSIDPTTSTRKIAFTSVAGFKDNDKVEIVGRKYTLTSKSTIDAVQEISIAGGTAPTSGVFVLTLFGKSITVDWDASAADIQTALRALDAIKNAGVVCAAGPLPASPVTVTFGGPLAGTMIPKMKESASTLDNGTPAIGEPTQGRTSFIVDKRPEDVDKWPSGTFVRKLRLAHSTGNKITVSGANRLYPNAIVELDNGIEKQSFTVKDVAGSIVTLLTDPSKSYVEDDKLHLVEAEVTARYAPGGVTQEEEVFGNLRLIADDPSSIIDLVNRRSNLIRVTSIALSSLLNDFPIASNGRFQKLDGGDDKYLELSTDDFVGDDGGSGKRTGIKALEDIEDISIVLAPGMWARSIVGELLRHSEAMRYRVAVLDAPLNADLSVVQEFRGRFDSKYAALYYPWVKTRQPGIVDDVVVPPSGHVAGIYADVDARRGVHKAPANEVIKSITEIDRDITRREQDLINPKGINALRFFSGRGNRVWGARTISSDSNFRYINVRRIFNFIERSIDEGTQFVVFEPNDPQLWSRVRQTINNFLNTQWRAGMLEGRVAEEAYFVACDRGVTMTQDDIENGRLICEVGIAPVFPAEFVIFRIQKFTADSKLA